MNDQPTTTHPQATDGMLPARCSALAPMDFAAALESLPKKELVRLLSIVGEAPKTARARERSVLAVRLARYVDKITIIIEWDSRMPASIGEAGAESASSPQAPVNTSGETS